MPACVHGMSPLGACGICTPPGSAVDLAPPECPHGAVPKMLCEICPPPQTWESKVFQIDRAEDHGQLAEGELVQDASGELRRVAKHRFGDGPIETWLLHWSDEYAVWLTDDGISGPERPDPARVFPLTRVRVVSVDDPDPYLPSGAAMTDDERGTLAAHARRESEKQDDFRYWDPNPETRLALKRRWREIADWFHPNPYGERPAGEWAELISVEDRHTTAQNAGHYQRVKVIRNEPGKNPMVDCPECGQPAEVHAHGDVKCLAVPACFGGWRVTVGPVYTDSTPTATDA